MLVLPPIASTLTSDNDQEIILSAWMTSKNAIDLEKDINERLETLVRGIAACTPYVGSAISGVIGFFWPASEPNPYAVWDEIKGYTSKLIEELISDERVKALENQLAGIQSTLNDYQTTSYKTPQKGQWFTSALSAINLAEPSFFDERNPEKTLTYFVSMGTIKITLLREQYLFYKDIYLVEDPDNKSHLKKVQDDIKKYRSAVDRAKKAALDWRLSLITLDYKEVQTFGVLGPSVTHIWSARDNHISDKMNPHPDYEESWEYNDLTSGIMDAEQRATVAKNRRRAQIEADLTSKLDSFLSPSYLWNYLDPANAKPAQKKPVDLVSGPYAGRSGQPFCDDARGNRITRVVIQANDRVQGVEIFYGGRSGGERGLKTGGPGTTALDLKDDESIVAAYGRAGDSIDALFFKTNIGRIVGGGGQGGSPWSASPPSGTDAMLIFISGVEGRRSFDGITLHWRYWRYE